MESLNELLNKSSDIYKKKYLPHVSIDCVIFGFHSASLKILLIKFKFQPAWGLPGGYIKLNEDMDSAAKRILYERTGAKDIFLQQFKTFGNTNRTENFFVELDEKLWQSGRFITIGYYALVDYSKVTPVIDQLSSDCKWIDVNELPKLMMDHQRIFDSALFTLRKQLNYKPIGLNLLPETFTMPELQKLYEIILNKKLNRGNFYRKITNYNILDKLPEPRKGGAHKAPNLYRFNLERYCTALENGFKETW